MATPTDEDRERARAILDAVKFGRGDAPCVGMREHFGPEITRVVEGKISRALADKGERVLEEAAKAIEAKASTHDGNDETGHWLITTYGAAAAVVRSLAGKGQSEPASKECAHVWEAGFGTDNTAWCKWCGMSHAAWAAAQGGKES